MPDLNEFYAFKMATSGNDSGRGRNSNASGNNGCGTGCITTLIVFAVIGWVLWLIGKF